LPSLASSVRLNMLANGVDTKSGVVRYGRTVRAERHVVNMRGGERCCADSRLLVMCMLLICWTDNFQGVIFYNSVIEL